MSKQIIETLKKGLSNKNLTDAQRKSVQAKIDALEEVENKSESSNKPSESKSNSVIETLKKGLSNKNLTDAQRKSVQDKIEALEKAESKSEEKKEVEQQPKAKKEKVVKQPKAKKEKVVKQPKAEKEVEDEKPFDNDEYCREIIAQETEKKAKRKEAAEKRKDAPKKKEATKIKEGIERLEDKVEEKVSKGKITKAEIIKLIDNTKALLKSLEKQLKEFGTKKMAEGGNVGHLKVGDIFEGTRNSTYEENWQLHKPSISYIIDNKTNRIVSIHNSPHEAIKERNKLNPNFKLHFKVYPKEHYQTKMAEGGNVEESEFKNMSAKDFVKEYYGINVFKSNPSEYFDIQKASYSNDDKVEQFINKYKNEGYSIKKKSYSDFTGLLAAKRKNDINKFAKGGNVEGGYKIFVGHDHRKNHELYQVVGIDNDYVGEWHKDIKDAEDELKDLDGISDSVSKFAKGGSIKRTKNAIDADKNLRAMPKGERVSHPFAIIRKANGETFKRRNANQFGEVEGDGVYTENRANRTDKDQKKRFAEGGNVSAINWQNFTLNELSDYIKNEYSSDIQLNTFSPLKEVRTNSGTEFKQDDFILIGKISKKDKDESLSIGYAKQIEATSGSENVYLNIVVYRNDSDKPFMLSIYTKEDKKGIKELASEIIEKFAKGGSIKRTKNAIDADKNLRAMPKGERVSHPFAIIRKANGETFKRRNANQFGRVEGDGVYTENRANRTDKDQKKRF